MLRSIFRSPRTPLASAKAASQINKAGETVVLHRVKIKPRSRLRSLGIGFGTLVFAAQIYTTVVLGPVAQWLDKELDEMDQMDEKELEEAEPIFIAFPFTTKQVESLPYRGSDEEWQTFIKVNKDQNLQMRIRNDLANIARTVAEANPILKNRLGDRMAVRRWWMDVDYPYKPSPTFERSGLEINDEGIDWVTKPVDAATVFRTQRILFPSPVAASMFSFAGTMLKQNVAEIAKMLGYEPKSPVLPVNPNAIIEKTLKQLGARPRPEASKESGVLPAPNHQTPDGTATPNIAADRSTRSPSPLGPAASKATSPTTPEIPTDPDKPASAKDLVPHSSFQAHYAGPWAAFKRKLAQKWRPMRDLPPRGAIRVSGLVELEGPRAYAVIDVVGWWNPKTRKFDPASMFMGLRRLQMKQQGPMR